LIIFRNFLFVSIL